VGRGLGEGSRRANAIDEEGKIHAVKAIGPAGSSYGVKAISPEGRVYDIKASR